MKKIETVSYSEEFRLDGDDNIYHLWEEQQYQTFSIKKDKPLIIVDRHGRKREINWGVVVTVLPK